MTFFRERPIKTLFSQIERSIFNNIDSYSEATLLNLDTENATDSLLQTNKFKIPILQKERITSSIVSEKLSGFQMPGLTTFRSGQTFDVDSAVYNIPFEGNSDFFSFIPSEISLTKLQGDVLNTSITITLSKYEKIIGNDKNITEINDAIIKIVDEIEKSLQVLENDLKKFMEELRPKITSYLKPRIEESKSKNKTEDLLNPFKKK